MITHYDLFAGIGGFSLAVDEIFHDESIKHIFCEWESFPTAVLKQHWPEGIYYGDIADLITDTSSKRQQNRRKNTEGRSSLGVETSEDEEYTILTGGFPCQPFSSAGRRRGTSDDRYKWPEMFAVIRNVKPTWVVAENVRGLVTWNEGMVLEQICTDLESEGYEVQPLIIPASAVNAPHRRDRIWIIANRPSDRRQWEWSAAAPKDGKTQSDPRGKLAVRSQGQNSNATDTRPQRRDTRINKSIRPKIQEPRLPEHEYPDWSRNWQEVALATCDDSVDDGLSRLVDGVPHSRAKWRKDSLKAYGNGIVSQVAMQIMEAIKCSYR